MMKCSNSRILHWETLLQSGRTICPQSFTKQWTPHILTCEILPVWDVLEYPVISLAFCQLNRCQMFHQKMSLFSKILHRLSCMLLICISYLTVHCCGFNLTSGSHFFHFVLRPLYLPAYLSLSFPEGMDSSATTRFGSTGLCTDEHNTDVVLLFRDLFLRFYYILFRKNSGQICNMHIRVQKKSTMGYLGNCWTYLAGFCFCVEICNKWTDLFCISGNMH